MFDDKRYYLSPSRAIKCPRNVFMESWGYPEPITPELQAIFDYGNKRHEVIQDHLIEKGLLLENQNPEFRRHRAEFKFCMEEPPMFGYADGVFSDHSTLLEIKTTSKSKGSLKQPLPGHIDQAMYYMHMSGIHKTLLLYEGKGVEPFRKKLFVYYDKDYANNLMSYCKRLLDKIQRRILPPPDVESCAWGCKNPACFDSEIHEKIGILKK